MAITEFSKNYHEKMFPKYHSAFLETDPEFIERFDNFAFDEVVNSDDLDDKNGGQQRKTDGVEADEYRQDAAEDIPNAAGLGGGVFHTPRLFPVGRHPASCKWRMTT